jgi:hypothetical protein
MEMDFLIFYANLSCECAYSLQVKCVRLLSDPAIYLVKNG